MELSADAQRVHAVRHQLQRIDIEAGIRFVENRQLRLQHSHLENLIALLLAAGEADVHGTVEQRLIHFHLAPSCLRPG